MADTNARMCLFGRRDGVLIIGLTVLDGVSAPETPLERSGRISASSGGAVARPPDVDTPAAIACADSALYRARSDGRNCVRVAADSVAVSDASSFGS
jgi:GGDEF domain-containing protein